MECDLLQSRGRARTFLTWQEQPSPNGNGRLSCIGEPEAQFAALLHWWGWGAICPSCLAFSSGREVDHPNLLARSLAAAAQVFGDLVGEANLTGGQK